VLMDDSWGINGRIREMKEEFNYSNSLRYFYLV
jgi:hypothetical protein